MTPSLQALPFKAPVLAVPAAAGGNLATSDLDHDGDPDVVFTEASAVRWARNNGDRTFSLQPALVEAGQVFSVVAVDMDRDGYDELVAAVHVQGGTDSLSLWYNKRDGTFYKAQSRTLTWRLASSSALMTGDFDRDGDPDLYVGVSDPADPGGHGPGLWFPNLGGLIDAPKKMWGPGRYPSGAVAMDVNRDGYTDIVRASFDPEDLSIFWGQGLLNNLDPATTLASPTLNCTKLVAADISDDAQMDLIEIADSKWGNNEYHALVMRLFLEGAAQAPKTLISSGGLRFPDAVMADISEDGVDDLVFLMRSSGGFSGGSIEAFDGRTLNAATPVRLPSAGNVDRPNALAAVDIDRDGDRDLIILNDSGLTVFENHSIPRKPFLNTSANFVLPLDIRTMAVCDWDRDGLDDVIAGTVQGDMEMHPLTYSGLGPRKLMMSLASPETRSYKSIATGDFDRDGYLDAVASSEDSVHVHSGATLSITNIFAAQDPRSLCVVDFDSDGDPDVLVVNKATLNLIWLRNNGGSPLTWTPDILGQVEAWPNEYYDFDKLWAGRLFKPQNGRHPVQILHASYKGLYLFTGPTGGQNWTRTLIAPPSYSYMPELAVADVDGNGWPDVIWGARDKDVYSNDGTQLSTGPDYGFWAPSDYLKEYRGLAGAPFSGRGTPDFFSFSNYRIEGGAFLPAPQFNPPGLRYLYNEGVSSYTNVTTSPLLLPARTGRSLPGVYGSFKQNNDPGTGLIAMHNGAGSYDIVRYGYHPTGSVEQVRQPPGSLAFLHKAYVNIMTDIGEDLLMKRFSLRFSRDAAGQQPLTGQQFSTIAQHLELWHYSEPLKDYIPVHSFNGLTPDAQGYVQLDLSTIPNSDDFRRVESEWPAQNSYRIGLQVAPSAPNAGFTSLYVALDLRDTTPPRTHATYDTTVYGQQADWPAPLAHPDDYMNDSQVWVTRLDFSPATPLEQWRQANFGTWFSEGEAANDADPDGDGHPNLLEYAENSNPKNWRSPQLAPIYGLGPVTAPSKAVKFRVSLREPLPAEVEVQLQSSTNLSYWGTLLSKLPSGWSGSSFGLTRTDFQPFLGIQGSEFTDKITPANSHRYYRLKVKELP